LPGRERRRLAGFDQCRAALPGQGPDSFDFNLSKVFRVNFRPGCKEP
jgi:hypothetical protein